MSESEKSYGPETLTEATQPYIDKINKFYNPNLPTDEYLANHERLVEAAQQFQAAHPEDYDQYALYHVLKLSEYKEDLHHNPYPKWDTNDGELAKIINEL
jgi:hypothetical protein